MIFIASYIVLWIPWYFDDISLDVIVYIVSIIKKRNNTSHLELNGCIIVICGLEKEGEALQLIAHRPEFAAECADDL